MLVAEIWPWVPGFMNVIALVLGLFLIFLVLIQRGKGGGLSGAFGGVGGSSAFGSRAGDLFTRITIIVASVWILLLMVQVIVMQKAAAQASSRANIQGKAAPNPPAKPPTTPPAETP